MVLSRFLYVIDPGDPASHVPDVGADRPCVRPAVVATTALLILAAFLGLVITSFMEDPRGREKRSHVQI